MSDMKCPFCNKPLQPTHRSENEYWCKNEDCTESSWKFGSMPLWQELIHTRKALDVAVGLLKIMNDGLPNGNRWKWEIEKALEQITALEQKD